MVIISFVLPKGPKPFTQVAMPWEKRKPTIIENAGHKVQVNTDAPKLEVSPRLPIRIGTYGGQVSSGILAQDQLTVGPVQCSFSSSQIYKLKDYRLS